MAEIFEKIPGVDNCLILSPRQAVQRQLAPAIVDQWNELRIGAFWSVTQAADPNAIPSGDEHVTQNSLLDLPFFGLKNWYNLGETSGDPNENAPGFAGSMFIGKGYVNSTSDSQLFHSGTDYWQIRGGAGYWLSDGYYETVSKGAAVGVGEHVHCGYDISADTLYGGLMAFKLTIANRGTATQSLTVHAIDTPWEQTKYTDVSANNLRAVLSQAIYTNTQSYTWNDGVNPYQVPDALYIRMPFFANRIRLHCVGILRIS